MYYAPATAFGITLSNNDVLTAKDQATVDDATLRSWTHTDGFGRAVETWSRGPAGNDKVATVYDSLGRVFVNKAILFLTGSDRFEIGFSIGISLQK